MSCECAKCREHYKTLGFMFGLPSESEIENSYHELVKQWHPDLYENYASLRADAEEHFKQIQIAYRELNEHNAVSTAEAPVKRAVVETPSVVVQPKEESPAISFSDAPGCLTAKHFTEQIQEMVAPHLGRLGLAVAIVDLSGNRSRPTYSHFFLLASRGIMVRDGRGIISVLWYTDMGEVNLIDRNKGGKQSTWQKLISGTQPGYELQVYRSNGALFQAVSNHADDSVKTALYNFLLQQKAQAHP